MNEAVFAAAHRHRWRGVHVNHAVRARVRGVDGTVEGESGRVDRPVTVADDVAVNVHLHQIGCRDLGVMQPERVDQKVLGLAGTRSEMWL